MASGASKGAKKIKPFDDQDTKLASGARFGITGHDVKYGTEAGKRWLENNPNYYMKPAPPGTGPKKA